MNSFLLNRQLGSISHHAFATAQNNRLLRSLHATPDVIFELRSSDNGASERSRSDAATRAKAHPAGVSSIAIDRFEGR
jgi:DNA excision repair protein ERCC-8